MTDSEQTESQFPPHRGWHSRGYLPHLDAPGLIQHITFHLSDSLPQSALDRVAWELHSMPPSQRALARRRRMHELLDAGRGSCVLAISDCAEVVELSLLHGDGDRYRLLCWTIMPNHVHVLIETQPNWPIGKLVQSWKRHSSRRIQAIRSTATQPLWQRDYWDRFVRNDDHLATTRAYIEQNPVKAGLVTEASQWPWGSARFRVPRS